MTVTHSGTASAPITFKPYDGPYFGGAHGTGFGFTLDSVSNFVIDGVEATGYIPIAIRDSTGVVIENSQIWGDVDSAIAVGSRNDRSGASRFSASRPAN